MSNNSLHLSLKKQWFKMTKSGIKTEDYREINEYWFRRFMMIKEEISYSELHDNIYCYLQQGVIDKTLCCFKTLDFNIMTLGYPKSTDTERILKLEHKGIEIRIGNPEWGAEPGKLYFVILHGAIIK